METTSTITDMNYRLVLDNVARFERNASSLPSIAIVNGGSVLVSDQGSFGSSGTYTPTIVRADQIGGFPIFNLFFNPSVTRNLTENWSMVPVTDIDKVRRLRCAYQLLIGSASCSSQDCIEVLEGYVATEPEKIDCSIPRGWYCTGRKRDVPKNACYEGHHCDTYAWVMPPGLEGLSRFTLTIMSLATSELEPPGSKVVVKHFDAEGKLLETEITTEAIDEDAPKPENLDESGAHLNSPLQPNQPQVLNPRSRTPKQSALTPKHLRKRGGP
jgi:hypothetical protein